MPGGRKGASATAGKKSGVRSCTQVRAIGRAGLRIMMMHREDALSTSGYVSLSGPAEKGLKSSETQQAN